MKNIRCSSGGRSYRKELPSFLHDRPSQFVDHIVTRMKKAHTRINLHVFKVDDKNFTVNSMRGIIIMLKVTLKVLFKSLEGGFDSFLKRTANDILDNISTVYFSLKWY